MSSWKWNWRKKNPTQWKVAAMMERCYENRFQESRKNTRKLGNISQTTPLWLVIVVSEDFFFFRSETKCRMKSIHLSVNGLAFSSVPSTIYMNVFAVMKKFANSVSIQCSAHSYAKRKWSFQLWFFVGRSVSLYDAINVLHHVAVAVDDSNSI